MNSAKLIPLATLGALGVLSAVSMPAAAHGTLEMPISRVYSCYKEGPESPKSAACRAAKEAGGSQQFYDWNGVRQGNAAGNHQQVVPNGKLCSGGDAHFRGLDLARADWSKTSIVPPVSGNYTFVWKATAPHATSYFKYYVTKDGWNPNTPLTWNDLQEFASVPGSAAQQSGDQYRMSVKLPQGKTGNHVIYSIWQRADSGEAFYACADVKFPGDTTPVPDPQWEEQSPLVANNNLPAGSTVTLRAFTPQGSDAGAYTVTLDATTGQANMWPYTLAQKVNAESSIFKIGVLQSRQRTVSIEPVKSATDNRVYRSVAHPGYRYEIDKQSPGTGGGGGGDEAWREGAAYGVGQIVSFQGRNYRCLQAHTAWAGAGWTPAATPTLWQAQ